MKTIHIDGDIPVLCVTAASFPGGVLAAHQKLHSIIPFNERRGYYGLSRPEGGGRIVYKAAAEKLLSDNVAEANLEPLTIKAGKYLSVTIVDFMKDIPAIGKAFQELLQQPGLHPDGHCLEMYPNQSDVICMVRLLG